MTREPGSDKAGSACWLFYGLSGTGKTTVAATFPGPVLLINIKDDGDESISDVDGVRVADPADLEELEAIYWFLRQNPKRYKTVVIDTITQMQNLVVETVSKRKSKAFRAGKAAAGAFGTMTKQQWGEAADIMKTQIVNFRDLPINTVFLAQQKITDPDEGETDEIDGIIAPEVGPAVMKSCATLACSSASFIGNTFIRARTVKKELKRKRITEYCMRVGPNPFYITKVRKPKSIEVPDFIVDPTYEDIQELRKGTTNGETERQGRQKQKGKNLQDRQSERRSNKRDHHRRLARR